MYQIRKKRGARRRVRSVERNMDGEAMFSILGLWSSMGQDEIYERWFRAPLEKHGAVLVWLLRRRLGS
jgi:hypothetical protein